MLRRVDGAVCGKPALWSEMTSASRAAKALSFSSTEIQSLLLSRGGSRDFQAGRQEEPHFLSSARQTFLVSQETGVEVPLSPTCLSILLSCHRKTRAAVKGTDFPGPLKIESQELYRLTAAWT